MRERVNKIRGAAPLGSHSSSQNGSAIPAGGRAVHRASAEHELPIRREADAGRRVVDPNYDDGFDGPPETLPPSYTAATTTADRRV